MKNFKMKPLSLSKKADMKIRIKLAFAQLKKNMQSFKVLQFAIPALVVGFVAIGVFTNLSTSKTPTTQQKIYSADTSRIVTELAEVRSDKYKIRAQKRARIKKAIHYKQYAKIRSTKLRSK